MKPLQQSQLRKRILVSGAALLLLLSNCVIDPHDHLDNNKYSAREDFSFSIETREQHSLDVLAVNGTLEIIGSNNLNRVEVWGTREVRSDSESDARRHLDDLAIGIIESSERISIETDQPDDEDGRDYLVTYYIRVPLDWHIYADQENGDILIANMLNSVDANLTNGELALDSINATVNADLTNGNIFVNGVSGAVNAELTNGNIIATVRLPLDRVCEMDVTNGNIQLNIPTTTSAMVDARVVNGAVQVFNLLLHDQQQTQNSITGRLGGGDGLIDLCSTNGTITLSGF